MKVSFFFFFTSGRLKNNQLDLKYYRQDLKRIRVRHQRTVTQHITQWHDSQSKRLKK